MFVKNLTSYYEDNVSDSVEDRKEWAEDSEEKFRESWDEISSETV